MDTLIYLILFYHPCVFYNTFMRRHFPMIFFLLLLVSCTAISLPVTQPSITPTLPSPAPSSTFIPSQTFALSASPTPSQLPATVTPSPSPTITAPHLTFTVYYHPDDALYVGDQVSVEVVSPPDLDVQDATLQVQVDPPNGLRLGSVKFATWGIQGRYEAALIWAWDTTAFSVGSHTLAFSVQPEGYTWTGQVTLLPSSDMPPKQAEAHWAETQTHCCSLFYITETASERDLPTLTTLVDAQAQDAIARMEASFTEPITLTVLPRLLGNGGFTSSEISVSYLDRNYASNDWALVVHHEMIHAIDANLGGDFRPTIFVEGLAVYMTGGHYKPELLMPRAAALLDGYLNWYLPLIPLSDDFYASQHEIGYLEAASLIEYMVNTYGLQNFFAFYRDIHNKQGESQSNSIEAALQAHYSLSFAQLEQDFITALKAEPDTAAWVDDVRLEVTYYETMRRYQQLLDPSAYFRTAWLMDNKAMRQRGIVADYLRHPHTPTNLALETLFITAGQQMLAKNYVSASQILDQITSVLGRVENNTPDPFAVSPMASDYLSISTTLQQQDYEVQNIALSGDRSLANVTTLTGPILIQMDLQRFGTQWEIIP
jgi:hypothetical protein